MNSKSVAGKNLILLQLINTFRWQTGTSLSKQSSDKGSIDLPANGYCVGKSAITRVAVERFRLP